jgi:hypothetical protein
MVLLGQGGRETEPRLLDPRCTAVLQYTLHRSVPQRRQSMLVTVCW